MGFTECVVCVVCWPGLPDRPGWLQRAGRACWPDPIGRAGRATGDPPPPVDPPDTRGPRGPSSRAGGRGEGDRDLTGLRGVHGGSGAAITRIRRRWPVAIRGRPGVVQRHRCAKMGPRPFQTGRLDHARPTTNSDWPAPANPGDCGDAGGTRAAVQASKLTALVGRRRGWVRVRIPVRSQSRGNRTVARAWRGHGAGVARAIGILFCLGWRGRGAGMVRACVGISCSPSAWLTVWRDRSGIWPWSWPAAPTHKRAPGGTRVRSELGWEVGMGQPPPSAA
eukprot:gene22299-biopygen11733